MANLDKSFKALENKLNRIERMGIDTVDKNYKKIIKDLEVSMANLYSKYEVNGQLTLAEMHKYNRLQRLDKEVFDMMTGLYKENSKVIRGTLRGIARDTYTNTIGITNKATKGSIKGILKDLPVDKIVNEDMKGLQWIERLGHHRSNAIWDIQKEIKQGLGEGDTYSTMTKRLKKRIESDRDDRINTIIRTESHKVKAAAKEESFDRIEKAGVQFKEKWLTAQDGDRVRTSHQAMNGVIVDRGEDFILPDGSRCFGPGDPSLPASEIINCRCVKILILE